MESGILVSFRDCEDPGLDPGESGWVLVAAAANECSEPVRFPSEDADGAGADEDHSALSFQIG